MMPLLRVLMVLLPAVKAGKRMRHFPDERILHALYNPFHPILVIGHQSRMQLACLE